MRWMFALRVLLLIPLWPLSVHAQAGGIDLGDGLTLPLCVLDCANVTPKVAECFLHLDVCGECKNALTEPVVMKCLTAACTPRELLTNLHTQAIMCKDPIRDRSVMYRTVVICCFVLAVAAIFIRYATHFTIGGSNNNWPDNIMLALLLILDAGIVAVCINMSYLGLGRDIWRLRQDDISPILMYFWVGQWLYAAMIGLIKILFLRFFFQIFPGKKFKLLVWIIIGFTFAFSITFTFLAAFGCTPISLSWEQWDGEHHGRCLDVNIFAKIHGGINIALDFITLALPISQIWKLQMSLRRKMAVMLMFSVGLFVTIVSILRLVNLIHFANTTNVTYDDVDATLWSNVEVQVGIVCVCMPAIRLSLVRLFPKVMGSTHQQSAPSSGAQSRGKLTNLSARITGGKRSTISDGEGSFVELANIETDGKEAREDSYPADEDSYSRRTRY